MRMFQSGTLALIAALFSLPSQANLGDEGKTTAGMETCFRVHVVYAMNPNSGELIPKIKTCLNRENAEEFQSCFSHSMEGGFDVQQAVDACRAKYNVSLFDGHI